MVIVIFECGYSELIPIVNCMNAFLVLPRTQLSFKIHAKQFKNLILQATVVTAVVPLKEKYFDAPVVYSGGGG